MVINNMKRETYTGVALPDSIIREIDVLIGKHGFVSRAEIIKEAARDIIRKYKEQQ